MPMMPHGYGPPGMPPFQPVGMPTGQPMGYPPGGMPGMPASYPPQLAQQNIPQPMTGTFQPIPTGSPAMMSKGDILFTNTNIQSKLSEQTLS